VLRVTADTNVIISGLELFGQSPAHPGDGRRCAICPASSILSGQRQLDFPILFDRYQQ
jgi:hypothetical protein